MSEKVLVAMSGGVDSSVAAYLLKKQGYECIGCTMKLYDNEDIDVPKGHTCCSLSDVEDAKSVAYRLGMPYYVFSYEDSFKERVIDKFVREYLAGRTPNPCIDCNKYMKFDLLYHRARVLGCDYIATGHYARIVEGEDGGFRLLKGLDPGKDQSYVLYQLSSEQLSHTLFPLGGLSKPEVRRIAEEMGFLNADKPDSQDICFVPDGDYVSFIERYTGKSFEPGEVVNEQGKCIGCHKGAIRYTIGQRKGLGIAAEAPIFVTGKDVKTNTVFVGPESSVFKKTFTAIDVCWVAGAPKTGETVRCKAMTRYRKKEQPADIKVTGEKTIMGIFDEPQRAITPGQSVVFYDGDNVLGGGIIDTVE